MPILKLRPTKQEEYWTERLLLVYVQMAMQIIFFIVTLAVIIWLRR